jgi:glycosyltransferase involved in cell wall biosynthesis
LPLFGTRLETLVSLHFPVLSTLPEFLVTWLKHNLQFASQIIVSTEADFIQLTALGIASNKIKCIPPMTDIEHLVAASSEFGIADPNSQNILCVQRFDGKSGHTQLIQAFAQLARSFPDSTLTLVGKGSLTTAFSNVRKNYFEEAVLTCKRLGMESRVRFCGHVELAKLPAFYEACDVVAHLSVAECFGLAVTEAMFFAKPIIATRVSGLVAQVCDGVSGTLVNVGDVDATRKALEQLLGNKHLRVSYGIAGKTRFRKHFCSRILTPRHISLYS